MRHRAVLRVTELDGTIGAVVWSGEWDLARSPDLPTSGAVPIGEGLVALVEIRRDGQ